MLLSLVSLTAGADSVGDCGDQGNNVTYSWDSTTKTLTFSGSGRMADFSENSQPWNTYAGATTVEYVVIGEGITRIGDNAFRYFNNITSVTIPNTVESIGKYAFHACSKLASITFSNQLKTIDTYAFYDCKALTVITLPNSLTSIGAHAFKDCSALKSIVLGSGLERIGGAFGGCTAVSDIHCYANPTKLVAWATSENEFKQGEEKTKCHVASDVRDTYASKFSGVNVTFVGDLGNALTGEGTVSNPYLLWSANDLVIVSNRFNSADETVVATVKGKYFQQIANLEFDKNTANNYTPIAQFDGDYNGNGYLISGLNVNKTGSDNAALFLTMANGSKVYNVIIKNSSIQGSQAAAIACVLGTTASITNCHVMKDVTITANNYYAGGLVAHMNDGKPSVLDCTSHAVVNAAQSYAGGVVGAVMKGSVVNCIYLGIADNIHYGAGKSGFAIAQSIGGTVDNCYYTASALNDANGKLVIANMADNSDFLEMVMERDEFLQVNSGLATSDINYDLTLNGRTLFKEDGEWNTLCLPFSVSNFAGTPLERAIVKTLVSSNYNNSVGQKTLTLTFSDNLTSIEAGKPYIVKWNKTYKDQEDKDANEEDCENPEFKNVTVGAAIGSTVNTFLVDFVGALSPVSVKPNDTSLLYMGHNNKLHYSTNGTTIGSCRSYFQLSSDEISNEARLVLNFGDEEEITGIDAKLVNREKVNSDVYDLQGRKVAQPGKGLYIVNGKKVIIK